MKVIVFSYSKGWNDLIEEEFEFENDVTEEEIGKEFEEWIWNLIGDNCSWYEKE
jgi:hypothetical protein